MEKEFGFEKLLVYQKSKEYVRMIYSLLKQFPAEERYAMCDQLRRASVSVSSNIAEGTSRGTVKEKIHFLDIAFGSLMETYSQMDIAKDLQYINEGELMQVREQCLTVLKLLAGLKKSYETAQEKQITDNYLKMKKKIIRACTVSMSIDFVTGMLPDLMKKYEVVILSSPGPEMDGVREQYGVKTIAVPMERHISLKNDLISLWRMIRVFRKEKPDMVHSMTPKAGLLCMMAAWLTRVPVRVHTFTGLVFPTATGLTRRILMATDAITCFCATHVIPEGEGVKNDLLNNGITHKPLKVLGYGNVRGVDMERFSRRENPLSENSYQLSVISYRLSVEDTDGLKDSKTQNLKNSELITDNTELITDNFVFLFVGRIVRDKGMNELMKAFQRLSEKYPNVRLVLVGSFEDSLDPVSEETKRIIQENPYIETPGSKYGDDLIRSYAEADCFVFPSYREGFPNTVLEAGAMGLPCIVTDINGSREIIVEKFRVESVECRDSSEVESFKSSDIRHQTSGIRLHRNGIIIPPRDEEALYAAMERMVTDEEMRKQMAANARPMIAQRFEQGFVRRCLYEFYEEIL